MGCELSSAPPCLAARVMRSNRLVSGEAAIDDAKHAVLSLLVSPASSRHTDQRPPPHAPYELTLAGFRKDIDAVTPPTFAMVRFPVGNMQYSLLLSTSVRPCSLSIPGNASLEVQGNCPASRLSQNIYIYIYTVSIYIYIIYCIYIYIYHSNGTPTQNSQIDFLTARILKAHVHSFGCDVHLYHLNHSSPRPRRGRESHVAGSRLWQLLDPLGRFLGHLLHKVVRSFRCGRGSRSGKQGASNKDRPSTCPLQHGTNWPCGEDMKKMIFVAMLSGRTGYWNIFKTANMIQS